MCTILWGKIIFIFIIYYNKVYCEFSSRFLREIFEVSTSFLRGLLRVFVEGFGGNCEFSSRGRRRLAFNCGFCAGNPSGNPISNCEFSSRVRVQCHPVCTLIATRLHTGCALRKKLSIQGDSYNIALIRHLFCGCDRTLCRAVGPKQLLRAFFGGKNVHKK